MTPTYAQTNLQLYSQLRAAGASNEDLQRVRAGYDLAMRLFTASFRGSGKPLLAHLVGTASILAAAGQSVDIVTAGLLHAAYALGDFGDGRLGMTDAKRARVRQAVGASVEDLVARYTAFDWNRNTIPRIRERVETLSPIERQVLVIRLANELEDHLDYGVLYCGNGEKRREYIRSPLNQSVDMARALGHTQLAAELDRAFRETVSTELPLALRNPHDYTFVQPPASHSPRPKVAVRRYLDHRPRLARLVHPLAALRVSGGNPISMTDARITAEFDAARGAW
jgi:(p)ppGpp synthase/HD superfamily hydrolase